MKDTPPLFAASFVHPIRDRSRNPLAPLRFAGILPNRTLRLWAESGAGSDPPPIYGSTAPKPAASCVGLFVVRGRSQPAPSARLIPAGRPLRTDGTTRVPVLVEYLGDSARAAHRLACAACPGSLDVPILATFSSVHPRAHIDTVSRITTRGCRAVTAPYRHDRTVTERTAIPLGSGLRSYAIELGPPGSPASTRRNSAVFQCPFRRWGSSGGMWRLSNWCARLLTWASPARESLAR